MKYHLEWPTELQALERKLLMEIEDLEKEFNYKKHAPTFYRIIEKKITFLKEVLGTIEVNPTITLEELAGFVDHRLETEEMDINTVRSKMGLSLLDKNGLIEIEKADREVRNSIIAIAERWDALAITFPVFLKKYPQLSKDFDIPKIASVYCKLFKPFTDLRSAKYSEWDKWFDIGYWAKVQGYSAASKKTAVKKWGGHTHRISVTQIKKKLPEVEAFAKDVVEYIPRYADFSNKILDIVVTDIELGKLFFDSARWLRHDSLYESHESRSKIYKYYYIHHPLGNGKGRKTCGPFKKQDIPGLRLIGSKPNELGPIIDGFTSIRDMFIELADMISEYPAADIEDSRKYYEVAKNTFL